MTDHASTPADAAARRASIARAVRDVARSSQLRRLEAAYLAFSVSEYATWLAVLIYAESRGGARAIALVTIAQVLPCTLLSPFAAYAGDRFPARNALTVGYAVQAAAMVTTATAMWRGQSAIAYAGAVVAAVAVSFSRPVMRSLIPSITHSPADLVSANVLTGFVEQIGVFVGPALAGLLLLGDGEPATVFAACAFGVAIGAVLVARLPATEDADAIIIEAGDVARNAVQGFVAIGRVPILAVLVGAGMLGALVRGASDLLFVEFAKQRYGTADGYSGALAAACGVGAVMGVVLGGHLVRLSRARYPLIAGVVAAALGFALLGISESLAAALGVFVVVGVGAAVLEFAASIAIQRTVDTSVLARVFGVLEALQMAALGAGTVVMSALVDRWSISTSLGLIAVGALGVGSIAVFALYRIGDRMPTADEGLAARILADRVFAPLPAPVVERLALGCSQVSVAAGEYVIREGEVGDRYYLVVDGELDVSIDGAYVRTLGPGTSFGEIALLRAVPRTATVAARTDAVLLGVDRDPFLEAVTGHPRSIGTAHQIADDWLGA